MSVYTLNAPRLVLGRCLWIPFELLYSTELACYIHCESLCTAFSYEMLGLVIPSYRTSMHRIRSAIREFAISDIRDSIACVILDM
jgi:hypothetical protein